MTRNHYYQGPPSDHFDGVRFFNPGTASTDRGSGAVLRWKVAGAAARWPAAVPVTPAKPDARVAGIRITMVGHASLLVQVAGINILTDPVWSDCASPFRFAGPKRVTVPMPLGNDQIVRAVVPGAVCVAGDSWQRLTQPGGSVSTLNAGHSLGEPLAERRAHGAMGGVYDLASGPVEDARGG